MTVRAFGIAVRNQPSVIESPAAVLVAAVIACLVIAASLLAGQTVTRKTAAATVPGVKGPVVSRHLEGPPRDVDGRPLPRAGRVAVGSTHPDENRHSTGTAVVSPRYVSGVVLDHQVLMADVVLPWRYHLDAQVAEMFDEATVHAAIAEWDGIPGSRWASSFAGYTAKTEGTGTAAEADGHSTIFIEPECVPSNTANTYLFTHGGLSIDRLGTTATQILEADVGICPHVRTADDLGRAVRHEIGHVLGLGHLCDPGDDCWQEDMGPGPHRCRLMFWRAGPCQTALTDDDRIAVASLYPRLRPLSGDDSARTLARASFAMFDDGTAPVAVVMRDRSGDGRGSAASVGPAAAALAARLGGTFLTAAADLDRCLSGPGAAEVSRSLARRGTVVLVGRWPQACDRLAYDWDVTVRRVNADDAVAGALQLAEMADQDPSTAVLTFTGGGDAASAAALAGARGVPLLLSRTPRVDDEVTEWLAASAVTAVSVVGAPTEGSAQAVATLRTLGMRAAVVAGTDRIATGLAVASLLRADGASGVVLTSATVGVEALAAAVVAVRDDAALVTSPALVDPRVSDWLDRAAPSHGWTVDRTAQVAPESLMAYGAMIGPG